MAPSTSSTTSPDPAAEAEQPAVRAPASDAEAAPDPVAEAEDLDRPAADTDRPGQDPGRSADGEKAGGSAPLTTKVPARRRRKATAAVTAPAPAAEVVQPTTIAATRTGPTPEANESQASGDGEQGAPPATEAKPPARRRRRVTAAATAPAQAPAAERIPPLPATPEGGAQAVPSAEDAPGDAASRETQDLEAPVGAEASTPTGVSETGQEDEALQGGAPAVEEDTAPRAGAEPDQDGEPDQGVRDGEPGEAPRLPAASLLFQAPDPARARRRRRKVTATTAPAPAAAEEAPAPEHRQDREEPQPDVPAAPERSRGRRRRKATAPATAPEHVEDEPAAPEAAAEGVDPDKSDPSDQSSETEEASEGAARRKRRRGGRGRRARSRGEDGAEATDSAEDGEPEGATGASDAAEDAPEDDEGAGGSRRRRRRRSRARAEAPRDVRDEVTALKGSTRLEAKRQRRREGRAAGRRRPIVTEAEFLARRESVDRQMIVREQGGLNQIAVLEDGLLVEHYVARHTQTSMVGNVYIGRVQNVLPSMEAAFVDLGKGRNAVLYAGEVNWDAAGMEGRPRRIEDALKSGDTVLVQVTKDPIGHKGARLTSQVTLAGRYLVLVPGGTMTGISRKLPDTERARLKKILKRIVPDDAGVIVRTAAEGASEDQLADDVKRLVTQWEAIDKRASQVLKGSGKAPVLLKGEPELAVRVVRDVFNEDFRRLVVSGADAWKTIHQYVTELSPDLADRLEHWVGPEDVFAAHRVDEQLAKGFDRKVWLPSGGTLVIDRTEAMTVIDVNTGRFTGVGGTLEETVTRNNIEAAEEIVRQLRLRDIGGMVVIDFVDMVLESNRDLVLRRLVECLGRDRTRHQVTEVTSLGLVQMTRKRVGQGLVEAFSTPCECCSGRGFLVHHNPVENQEAGMSASAQRGSGRGRGRKGGSGRGKDAEPKAEAPESAEKDDAARAAVRGALAQIAAAAEHAHKDAQSEQS